jgi:predicted transposase YdaD
MANSFDRVFKEEAEILIKAIATKVLGIRDFDHTEPVTASLHKTLERDPDWLRKVCHFNSSDDYIFHGEVHNKDEAVILDRNLIYYGLLWYGYHLPIRQVVVYTGRKKNLKNIVSELHSLNMNYRFDVINMHKVPVDLFIDSDRPEEVILSILCDYKGESSEVILKKILIRLRELDEGGLTLEKHLVQLEIISDLRNLQSLLTKIMDTMPITYDIRRDLRFKQGKLEGKLEGEAEGIAKGKAEQALLKDQSIVIRLLKKEIYALVTIAEIADVSLDFVEKTKTSYENAVILLKNKDKSLADIAKQTGIMIDLIGKI